MPSKKVQIKHVDRVQIDSAAFERVIKKFGRVKNKVIISFDNRISDYGQYFFDSKKKAHIIKISPKRNVNDMDGKPLSEEAKKYQIISTSLHELRHAQQREVGGAYFNRFSYSFNKKIKEHYYSYFFSECELDARKYETSAINSAIKLYNKHTK